MNFICAQGVYYGRSSKYTCKGLKAAFVGKSQKDDDIREGVDSWSSLEKQFRQEYEGSLSKIFSASAGTWTTECIKNSRALWLPGVLARECIIFFIERDERSSPVTDLANKLLVSAERHACRRMPVIGRGTT